MQIKFLLFLSALFNLQIHAQDGIVVSQGASYQNQVWYSLRNGVVTSSPKNNWDIAFQTTNRGSSIHINSASGVKLWAHPTAKISDWATLDTTGLSEWTELNNSSTSWDRGAFTNAAVQGNSFDVGWGLYSMITHHVNGNRIFIIQTKTGKYKKFYVESLINRVYKFHVSDINHENLVSGELNKNDYDKNFMYYDIDNAKWENREPNSNTWDITFTQYIENIPSPYLVTGILLNEGVTAAKVTTKQIEDFAAWDTLTFSANINIVGHDWKAFNMNLFRFTVSDSTLFVLKTANDDVFKINFTAFSGQSLGNYTFNKELLVALNASNISFENVKVYPKPSTNGVVFVDGLNTNNGSIHCAIYNLQGGIVAQENTQSTPLQLNLQHLNKGMYILQINQNNQIYTQKLIIQ